MHITIDDWKSHHLEIQLQDIHEIDIYSSKTSMCEIEISIAPRNIGSGIRDMLIGIYIISFYLFGLDLDTLINSI
jgi:hypothetical protein